jgi:quercetin dioxygenase-like cupin family protein
MLLHKELKIGDLVITIFDFETTGDVLPKHIHDETNVHITIVCHGKIKAYSHDWEVEAVSGQIVDFRVGEPHEIMALENKTRIINIIKKHGYDININDYQQLK